MYGNSDFESIDLSALREPEVKKISHVKEDIETYISNSNFGNINF